MGDASDNIPGVKGIGEKTAYKLVQDYGTVEEIMKKAGSLKPDKANKLVEAGLEDIKLSKQLAVLKVDPALIKKTGFNLKDCGLGLINRAGLDAEFIKYNFKSLVSSEEQVKKEAKPAGKASHIGSFDDIKEQLEAAAEVSIVFCGGDRNPELVLVSAGAGMFYLFGRDFTGLPGALKGKKIYTNSSKTVYTFLGREAGDGIMDIMLMAYLLNPEKSYNDMSHIFTEYGGGMYLTYEDVSGKGAKKVMIELADPASLSDYASSMLETAPGVAEKLLVKMKEEKIEPVYTGMELPVSYVLSVMESTGLRIDRERLDELLEKTQKQIKDCEEKIYGTVGFEFNINSPKQLGEVLFEKLNLPKQRKNKTGLFHRQ